jgi:hypothetical protein
MSWYVSHIFFRPSHREVLKQGASGRQVPLAHTDNFKYLLSPGAQSAGQCVYVGAVNKLQLWVDNGHDSRALRGE